MSKEHTEEHKKKFKGKEKEALDYALDIRKFEINLYWKRATYFWTFIGAALVGYVAIQTGESADSYLTVMISSLGLIFSFAWVLVNKGSKKWVENWEAHVDLLEDDIIGPLYKTVLTKGTGKSSFSVSKVNLIISIYVFVLWFLLFIHSLFGSSKQLPLYLDSIEGCVPWIIAVVVIVMLIMLYFWGKTSPAKKTSYYEVEQRKTEIK